MHNIEMRFGSRCVFSFAVLFVLSGLVLILTGPLILNRIVHYAMVLKPETAMYNSWQKVPNPVFTDFYLFNWTNPNKIHNDSVKPKLQQLGPYRYREVREKSDIVWNDNGTVSFRIKKHWYFEDQEENGDLEDTITIVSPVPLVAAYMVRKWNYVVRKGLSLSLSTLVPTIHTTTTIRQLLFDGYPDSFMSVLGSMPSLADKVPPTGRFGLFHLRNGTSEFDGVTNMGTGRNSILGEVYSWNSLTQTPHLGEGCNKVEGFSGEFFKPNLERDFITLYAHDLCRTLVLEYEGESYIHGILGYKYVLGDRVLDNGTIYPKNKCYCNGDCMPSGLMNTSSCNHGSPIFTSLPHFYKADPYYQNLVDGLGPEKEKHEFFMIVEPMTGIPLKATANLQVNFMLQTIPDVTLYENVPKAFFPLMWVHQQGGVSEDQAFKLKILLHIPIICSSLGILFIFIGLALLASIIYKRYKLTNSKKNKDQFGEQKIPLNTYH